MARNRNREFSEGSGLNPMNLGNYANDAEERRPIWAKRSEGEDMSSWKRPAPEAEHGGEAEDILLPEAPKELPEAPAPDEPLTQERQESEPEAVESPNPPQAGKAADTDENPKEVRENIVQTRAEKDPEDEPREAVRVESGALNRRNMPAASGKPAEANPEKDGKTGKTTKKAPKKGKKSKKKKTPEEERQGFLRIMMIILLCGGLFLMAAVMVLSNFVKLPILAVPQKIVTAVVSPIQSFFSTVTGNVADYLRMLKIRGNIEYEYEQLRAKLDDYATDVAMMEELRREIEELNNQLYEQQQPSHAAMDPIAASVIGTVGNNYFSTLTLNVGSDNGVADYMAVVSAGGLVGVTYNVKPRQCDVRCIIDSDCTVAGLVQSSRDQGSVKGTLGTNGEPMCRMYYLPDNSLPRPWSSPRASPSGTSGKAPAAWRKTNPTWCWSRWWISSIWNT